MNDIEQNIQHIQQQLDRQDVTIMAVSKTQPIENIRQAYHAGIRNFGENYLQEAQKKIPQLQDLDCTWHYIGSIQSKKCKKICEYFDWVHTIDSLEQVNLFAQACQTQHKSLKVCIQVSLFNEAQKSGVSPNKLESLVQEVLKYPQLELKGLMTILPNGLSDQENFNAYQSLANLMHQLNNHYNLDMDTLSMGMSADFKQAIEAGSTIVRIGQAIFGSRK